MYLIHKLRHPDFGIFMFSEAGPMSKFYWHLADMSSRAVVASKAAQVTKKCPPVTGTFL